MIISMSIHVHDCPFFPVALQHHRTTPGLQRLTWDTFMPLISTSSAKLLSVPKVCDGIDQSQKPLLNQNPSSSPVHILGSLQRSYPAPPGICHTGTTHLMLWHAWEKMFKKSLKMIEDVQSHSTCGVLKDAMYWYYMVLLYCSRLFGKFWNAAGSGSSVAELPPHNLGDSAGLGVHHGASFCL